MNLPANETPNAVPPPPPAFINYLVVAADMAFHDGRSINGCQMVLTSADCMETAFESAQHALEDGCIPVAALDVTELRQLAAVLEGRTLAARQSYNLSTGMTDAEMQIEAQEEEDTASLEG